MADEEVKISITTEADTAGAEAAAASLEDVKAKAQEATTAQSGMPSAPGSINPMLSHSEKSLEKQVLATTAAEKKAADESKKLESKRASLSSANNKLEQSEKSVADAHEQTGKSGGNAGAALGGLHEVIGNLSPELLALFQGVQKVQGAMGGMRAATASAAGAEGLAGVVAAAGPVVGAIGTVIGSVIALNTAWQFLSGNDLLFSTDVAEKSLRQLSEFNEQFRDTLQNAVSLSVQDSEKAVSDVEKHIKCANAMADAWGVVEVERNKAMLGGLERQGSLIDAQEQLNRLLGTTADQYDLIRQKTANTNAVIDEKTSQEKEVLQQQMQILQREKDNAVENYEKLRQEEQKLTEQKAQLTKLLESAKRDYSSAKDRVAARNEMTPAEQMLASSGSGQSTEMLEAFRQEAKTKLATLEQQVKSLSSQVGADGAQSNKLEEIGRSIDLADQKIKAAQEVMQTKVSELDKSADMKKVSVELDAAKDAADQNISTLQAIVKGTTANSAESKKDLNTLNEALKDGVIKPEEVQAVANALNMLKIELSNGHARTTSAVQEMINASTSSNQNMNQLINSIEKNNQDLRRLAARIDKMNR